MSKYDSQGTVSGFLAKIRGEAIHESTKLSRPNTSEGCLTGPVEHANNLPGTLSVESSPMMSPDAANSTSLDPINQTEPEVAGVKLPLYSGDPSLGMEQVRVDQSRTLRDSVYATGYSVRSGRVQPASGRNMLDLDPAASLMTPTQKFLLKEQGKSQQTGAAVETEGFGQANVDGVVEAEGQGAVQGPFPVDDADHSDVQREEAKTGFALSTVPEESSITNEVGQESQVMSLSPAMTPVTSPAASEFKPSISVASPTVSPTPITVHKEFSAESLDARPIALKQATDILANKIADVKVSIKEDGPLKRAEEGEDNREHAVYFSAWGTPEIRNKPKSRVRKVIISGLPGNADYTFVQALIHGGSLESLSLNPGGSIAHVLFTDGEACDRYANTYPNGISFKHKGKTLVLFVDKGKDVDVVSSMLDAYLSAGASRVVKASNVDEDWSMRALHTIAAGADKKRKVEYISDDFRNEARTVIFRFANVADAVAFRNTLRSNPEWEIAEIQFGMDPCEKATGFHFD